MATLEPSRRDTIRSYLRQQHAIGALRAYRGSWPRTGNPDQMALSAEARQIQRVRQLAVELVARLHPDLPLPEQTCLVAALEQKACARYGGRWDEEALLTDVLEGWLGALTAPESE